MFVVWTDVPRGRETHPQPLLKTLLKRAFDWQKKHGHTHDDGKDQGPGVKLELRVTSYQQGCEPKTKMDRRRFFILLSKMSIGMCRFFLCDRDITETESNRTILGWLGN